MLVSDRIRKDLINSIKKQVIETAPCKIYSKPDLGRKPFAKT